MSPVRQQLDNPQPAGRSGDSAVPAVPDDVEPAPEVSWDDHRAYLDEVWEPGQHVSIIAPTGRGKTYLATGGENHRQGLLSLWTRHRVLIVDPKRDRGTMSTTPARVTQSHPDGPMTWRYRVRHPESEDWDHDPEWFKLQPRDHRWDPRDRDHAPHGPSREAIGRSLDRAFHQGNWVIYIDEVADLSDRRDPGLDLGPLLSRIWREGRDRKVTLIAGTQQPAWAPSQMFDQPTYLYLGRNKDARRTERYGEIAGDRDLIDAVLPELQGYEFLFLDQVQDESAIVEVPPP